MPYFQHSASGVEAKLDLHKEGSRHKGTSVRVSSLQFTDTCIHNCILLQEDRHFCPLHRGGVKDRLTLTVNYRLSTRRYVLD